MRFLYFLVGLLVITKLSAQNSELFHEQYRPQYHFTPQKYWTNDPNGLVFQNGVYHLFFQYNPFENKWGHMSWGHATSADLIHWKELPVAILEEDGKMIFSGSAVLDQNNKTGFNEKKNSQPLVAIYTSHTDTLQAQHLAYSNDNGYTWKKYPNNPVLNLNKKDFRDPNVFWYELGKYWVMAVSQPVEQQISFYKSTNLKNWEHLSEFGPRGDLSGVWECPDLMQVPIVGEKEKTKWVLFTSQNSTMQYFVGDFDGIRFLEDNPHTSIHKQDYGTDYYAAVTYHNTKEKQPISIGWINNWEYANEIPTKPWKGAMSIPRKLSVKNINHDWVLIQEPINTLNKLGSNQQMIANVLVTGTKILKQKGKSFKMDFDLYPVAKGTSGLKLAVGGDRYFMIGYDSKKEKLFIDRTNTFNGFSKKFAAINRSDANLKTNEGKIHLKVFFDESIVEIYTDDGMVVFTSQVFPEKNDTGIILFSDGGISRFENIRYQKINSAH